MDKILLIEDDIMFGRMLEQFLTRNGYKVQLVHSGEDARQEITRGSFALVLSDLRLPDVTGLELLEFMLDSSEIPVVMMSSHGDITTAVSAMKAGAADYITKPLKPEEVLAVIRNNSGKSRVKPTADSQAAQETYDFVEGTSEAARRLSHYVNLVGPTEFSVLIEGESGTGKEVLARRLHQKSARADKVFLAVDCGAIPKDLASSEFFGHKKGSFTGAVQDKTGYFVAADGGTLFLDEVGNLSYEHQIQLLRALQERKIRPVGGLEDIPVDIRILAATNENLRGAIAEGKFREDLYHRLNEFAIHQPALRDRDQDIILFAMHFLDNVNRQLGKDVYGFSPEVLAAFSRYNWPGNLREMHNVIKRATLLAQDKLIHLTDLPLELSENPESVDDSHTLKDLEKETILKVLRENNFNRTRAAEQLNINRKTLYNKLKSYGIED
jgi:two-component system response regulator HydG